MARKKRTTITQAKIVEWIEEEEANEDKDYSSSFGKWDTELDGNFALGFFVNCFLESDRIGPNAAMEISNHDPLIEFRKLLTRIVLGWHGKESADGFIVNAAAISQFVPIQFVRPLKTLPEDSNIPIARINFAFSKSRREAESFLMEETSVILLETTPGSYTRFKRHLKKFGKREDTTDVISGLDLWSGYLVPTMIDPDHHTGAGRGIEKSDLFWKRYGLDIYLLAWCAFLVLLGFGALFSGPTKRRRRRKRKAAV